MEFLAIGLLTAVTPLPQLALTTLLVNVRHAFYALSFPLHLVRGRGRRLYSMYALTDESYALAAAKDPAELTGARVLWLQGFCQGYWLLGTLAGALAGTQLSLGLRGLPFTLTALFVVLAMDAVRVARDLPSPILAGACCLVALALAPGELLVVAMGLFTLLLLARFALTEGRRDA
jgi:4-azaleucine resistance transporter AzlC